MVFFFSPCTFLNSFLFGNVWSDSKIRDAWSTGVLYRNCLIEWCFLFCGKGFPKILSKSTFYIEFSEAIVQESTEPGQHASRIIYCMILNFFRKKNWKRHSIPNNFNSQASHFLGFCVNKILKMRQKVSCY